jgi:hypothetical protein
MGLWRLLELLRPGRRGRQCRVLVATSPGVRDAIAPILSGCPVEFACDMAEGLRALAGAPFTHVVVGYLFAESQMFEFVRHVRAKQPAARVVCVKAVGRKLSPGTRAGLHEAARALGCEGFFDLTAGDVPEALFRSTFEQVVAHFASRTRKPHEQAVVEELRSAVHQLREIA